MVGGRDHYVRVYDKRMLEQVCGVKIGRVKIYLHITFFSPFPLLPPLKFSIVRMMTVLIMDRRGDCPFSLSYSDDSRKNIFDNSGHD